MRNAKDLTGICKCCKNWTSLWQPCCNHAVLIDGSWTEPGNFCEHCGDELNRDADCDRCDVEPAT